MLLRRLGLLGVALAMFSIAGGPYAVLQTVAWAEMLRDYCQQTGSLAVAVEQTFDGQHPCELCRQVAAAKSQEQKQTPAKSLKASVAKAKALPAGEAFRPERPAGTVHRFAVWTARSVRRAEPPPTPPPRGFSRLA